MKQRILPALAAVAALSVAASASAYDSMSREDGMRMKKSRACTNMIDNSASAGVVHKGGANTAKTPHELTFDNCMPVSASNRYNRDRDYSYANENANMQPASGYDSSYENRAQTRAERAAERADRNANRSY